MNKEDILHFINHNKKRVIGISILVLCTIIIGVGAKISARRVDPNFGAKEKFKESTQDNVINDIINSYYDCYANNNIEELEKIAYPISDMEKSYIQFMSTYTDGYEVEKILSKPGVTKDSYLVTVDVNINFAGVDDVSPGLYFFYLTKDAKDDLYIDNRYCLFNQEYVEEETDPEIQSLIETFKDQEDFILLQHDINVRYNALLEEKPEYSAFIDNLRTATFQWFSAYQQSVVDAQAQAEADAAALAEAEAQAQAEAEAQAQAEADAQAQAEAEADAATETETNNQSNNTNSQPAAGGYKAGDEITVSDILNMREKPDANSTKVGAVLTGQKVKVLEDSGADGWTKVERSGGKQGYIRTDLLK